MVIGSVTANKPASKPGLTNSELEELRSGIEGAQSNIEMMVPASDALSFLNCTQAALDGLNPEAVSAVEGLISAVFEAVAEMGNVVDSLIAAATATDTALDEIECVDAMKIPTNTANKSRAELIRRRLSKHDG